MPLLVVMGVGGCHSLWLWELEGATPCGNGSRMVPLLVVMGVGGCLSLWLWE